MFVPGLDQIGFAERFEHTVLQFTADSTSNLIFSASAGWTALGAATVAPISAAASPGDRTASSGVPSA